MTPEKRKELTGQLALYGLTVLLTRDYKAIIWQLARLAEFERRMIRYGKYSPLVANTIHHIHTDQATAPEDTLQLDVLMIPVILAAVNRALAACMDADMEICPAQMPVAVAAFVGILCAEAR